MSAAARILHLLQGSQQAQPSKNWRRAAPKHLPRRAAGQVGPPVHDTQVVTVVQRSNQGPNDLSGSLLAPQEAMAARAEPLACQRLGCLIPAQHVAMGGKLELQTEHVLEDNDFPQPACSGRGALQGLAKPAAFRPQACA